MDSLIRQAELEIQPAFNGKACPVLQDGGAGLQQAAACVLYFKLSLGVEHCFLRQ
jgi:hypothetical protein